MYLRNDFVYVPIYLVLQVVDIYINIGILKLLHKKLLEWANNLLLYIKRMYHTRRIVFLLRLQIYDLVQKARCTMIKEQNGKYFISWVSHAVKLETL